MPILYNTTKYSESTGYISFLRITNELVGNYFGLMLLFIMFTIPLIVLIRRGEDVNKSINLSSFYTLLLAIVLYLGQIVTNTLFVFIPGLIYAITFFLRWYHKDI